MTGAEFVTLLKGYRVVEMHCTGLLDRFPILGRPGQWINGVIAGAGRTVTEAVSFNMVCVLEKPGDASVAERTLQ